MLAERPLTSYTYETPIFSLGEIDFQAILKRMVDEVRKIVDFQWVSVYVVDRNSNRLQEVSLAENGFNFIELVQFNRGKGLAAWVAQQKRPLVLSSVHRGQRFRSNPVKSFICCPIVRNDVTLGVITMGHSSSDLYTKSTLKTLMNFFEKYLAEYFMEVYS